ncbi:ATP-dependent helicase HrpB [Stenotrophomonas sp. MMGLT7]|uniref:ATP-dependent helicase HrpB n=1 Tax=Stenotrophomonas sp. MMGLT7 TaxID=2901227 RepID=UPI001E55B383|nr:ATP-dependent helicase HrpB [Stenotrophomonas sp. MMGLT7]MCD7099147.1 ATP-dependent helicase HrpB [Stenotrophomonas sp. MMGLT7]
MTAPPFPISPLLPAIADSLAAQPRLVLEAPPGAGKTTQVPLALLDAPWLAGRRIVMLEPRRVAARSAAQFMARQLGERVGETVGYRIRFDNQVSARTRIEVVTEGILTRMIQDDPSLEGIGALLFDEFHERHLSADLGLALALDVQAQLREDLRIVLMSATLDGERLAAFLQAPRLSSEGRGHPVQVAHFPARRDESLEAQARRAVEQALQQHPGDVLVFLPGQREIVRVQAALGPSPGGRAVGAKVRSEAPAGSGAASPLPSSASSGRLLPQEEAVDVLPLHGELPVEQQSQVLQPDPAGRRRVVLATNVAESSVTLPGVRVVIDAGLAREPRFDPNSGFSRLDVVAIAQASADQRAGRAGRVAEGFAYRLWPASQRLEAQRRPEIAQVELAALALELAAWGSDDLRFVDPPPPGALAAARELLQRLGALSASGGITGLGRRMLALGTHPRLAAMLLFARSPREQALAADLAALLEARDPLRSRSDALAERWRALAAFRHGRTPHDASRGALAAIDAASKQWRRRLRCDAKPPADIEAHELGDLLAHAFPERIAARHPSDPLRYQLANGRMARLFDDSALRGEPWLVASELRFESRGDALLLHAAPVDEGHLRRAFADRFSESEGAHWDSGRRALVALRQSRFDRIVLDSRPAGRVDPAQAAQALTEAVRDLGLEALPWTPGLRQWQARAVSLRQWMPELELADVSDAALLATLDDWLRPAFAGKSRLDAMTEEELGQALKSPLPWSQRQLVDRHAPARIAVPSGLERRIEYALDHEGQAQPPVLAVKLQELFGLADTPRIADARVPLLLHLLSPGGKPLQVTRDLRSFWASTYAEVRKEMKGRYPKHPWPDDPWTATATHRAKPRGT